MDIKVDLSLIVPYHNEKHNLAILWQKIVQVFRKISNNLCFKCFEIIFIDDGSNDNSTENLIKIINNTKVNDINLKVEIYRLSYNMGQSAALSLGFSKFSGKYVATIDSDLQNDPEDIYELINLLITKDLQVISGYRKNRNEGMRGWVSKFGNLLIRLFSGYDIKDVGCSLKVYKSEVIKNIVLPKGYHRFLPIISKANKSYIKNFPVKHFNRIYGKSHYNYSRIFWLLKNIFILPFIKRYNIDVLKKNYGFFKFLTIFLFTASIFSFFVNYKLFPISLIFLLISVFINQSILEILNFTNYFGNINYERVYCKGFFKLDNLPEELLCK